MRGSLPAIEQVDVAVQQHRRLRDDRSHGGSSQDPASVTGPDAGSAAVWALSPSRRSASVGRAWRACGSTVEPLGRGRPTDACRRQRHSHAGDDSLLDPRCPGDEPDELHHQQCREHVHPEQSTAAADRGPPQHAKEATGEHDERHEADGAGPQQGREVEVVRLQDHLHPFDTPREPAPEGLADEPAHRVLRPALQQRLPPLDAPAERARPRRRQPARSPCRTPGARGTPLR